MSKFKSSTSTKEMMAAQPKEKGQNPVHFLAVINNGLEERADQIQKVLPEGYDADRFITTAYYYLRAKPDLWKCTPQSFYGAFLDAAQQGLDFAVPNEAHIVPYGNKATLLRGYKGDLKNVRRNPKLSYIDAKVIYEHDLYEVEMGDTPRVIHKPPKFGKDRGKSLGFYSVAKDINGNVYHEEMTNEEIWQHAKDYTQASTSGPFAGIIKKGPEAQNWESYGLKTVIHRICTRKLDLNTYHGQALMREYEREDKPKVSVQINDAAFRPTDAVFEAELDPVVEEEIPTEEGITEEKEITTSVEFSTEEEGKLAGDAG